MVQPLTGAAAEQQVHGERTDEELAPGRHVVGCCGRSIEVDEPQGLGLADLHPVGPAAAIDEAADRLDLVYVDDTRLPPVLPVRRARPAADAGEQGVAGESHQPCRTVAGAEDEIQEQPQLGRIRDHAVGSNLSQEHVRRGLVDRLITAAIEEELEQRLPVELGPGASSVRHLAVQGHEGRRPGAVHAPAVTPDGTP